MKVPDISRGYTKYKYYRGAFFLHGYDEGSYERTISELKFPCYIQFGQEEFKFFTKDQVKDYLNYL